MLILRYLLTFSLYILPLPSLPVQADIKIRACWGFAAGKKAKIVKILQSLRRAMRQECLCASSGERRRRWEAGEAG